MITRLISLCSFILLYYSFAEAQNFFDGHSFSEAKIDGGVIVAYPADIDRDGDLDIVATAYLDDKVVWFENMGNKEFSSQRFIANIDRPQGIIAVDLDDDEDLDIVVASEDDNKLYLLENIGGRKFAYRKDIASGNSMLYVAAADFDNDGDLDLAFTAYDSDLVAWVENLGFLTFSGRRNINTNADHASGIAVGDLDNDGDIDIVSTSTNDDKIAWYENLGNKVFSTEKILLSNSDRPTDVEVADLDNDGYLDIISTSYGDNKTAWYKNNRSGSFSSEKIISTTAYNSFAIEITDLDKDGWLDVITSIYDGSKIAWHKNNKNGTFGAETMIGSQSLSVTSLIACDIDGDKDQDIVASSFDDDKVSWYENVNATTFTPYDITSNKELDSPQEIVAGDLNGDGNIDLVATSQADDKVVVYESNSNKSFYPPRTISQNINGPEKLALADLDNDNDLDIIVATEFDDSLLWYENLGGIIFSTSQRISNTLVATRILKTGDLDNDGDIDVAVCTPAGTIVWYENLGNKNFQLNSIRGSGTAELELSDVDTDGDLDIVVVSSNGFWLEYYTNLGNGNFSTTTNSISFGTGRGITKADIDGDGDDDYLAYLYSHDELIINENFNNGRYSNKRVLQSNVDRPDLIIPMEVDGNNYLDIVAVSAYAFGKVKWYKNFGGGNFSSGFTIGFNRQPDYVTVADIDGDNDNDLIYSEGVRDKVWWVENMRHSVIEYSVDNCEPYRRPGGTRLYDSTGTYMELLRSSLGGDSTIIINLNIIPDADTTINRNGFELSANQLNADSYQWINCDSNNRIIAGANQRTYLVNENGNYAVVIKRAMCIDTSACFRVTNVGIGEIQTKNNHLKVYPNPTNDRLRYEIPNYYADAKLYRIYDSQGKLVLQGPISFNDNNIQTNTLEEGLYLIYLGELSAKFLISR